MTHAMNEQLQQQVLERLRAFTADVTLAVIATMCDPRNKEFPLREPVLVVTTDRILEYKKFQQRGGTAGRNGTPSRTGHEGYTATSPRF